MLSPNEIDQLARFDGGGARVLSTYLDLDPGRQARRSYRVAFKDLVAELRETLDEPARRELARELVPTTAWLENQVPQGKGLAIFSSAPGLFRAYFLPVRVEDHIAFDPRPDIAPLLGVIDDHERYAVALVDKRRARLFSVYLGAIEESEAFKDFVFHHHDQGGISQSNFQRHHEAHVYRHLKKVVEHLKQLYRRRDFDRLILAGPEEPTSELRRLLPRGLARQLMAVIPAETTVGAAEILEKTMEVERRIESEAEERFLAEVFEVGGGGRATYGVAPTLDALWLGAVQTLVMAEGVGGPASDCPNCGKIEPGTVANCPACGTAMKPAHDLYHLAARRTLDQAGSVELVHGDAARRLHEKGGGLGALLRYRWSKIHGVQS